MVSVFWRGTKDKSPGNGFCEPRFPQTEGRRTHVELEKTDKAVLQRIEAAHALCISQEALHGTIGQTHF